MTILSKIVAIALKILSDLEESVVIERSRIVEPRDLLDLYWIGERSYFD